MDIVAFLRAAALLGAWTGLAAIAFVTTSPIDARPVVTDIKIEHFGAFALIGLLFTFAYPRKVLLILTLVVGAAVCLEALQLIAPGRHGRLVDLTIKVMGGGFGVGIAAAANAWLLSRAVSSPRRLSRPKAPGR
jgi:VanZ family protein